MKFQTEETCEQGISMYESRITTGGAAETGRGYGAPAEENKEPHTLSVFWHIKGNLLYTYEGRLMH